MSVGGDTDPAKSVFDLGASDGAQSWSLALSDVHARRLEPSESRAIGLGNVNQEVDDAHGVALRATTRTSGNSTEM